MATIDDTKINGKNRVEDKPVNIDRYQDLDGVSMKKLEAGLWYLEHRELFFKILIGALIAIAVATWTNTLWNFGYYLFKGMNEDEALIRQLLATRSFDHDYIATLVAHPPIIGPVSVFEVNTGKGLPRYDLYATITNPNPRQVGSFDYSFKSAAGELADARSFLLPGETKVLLALSIESDRAPENVQLAIQSISWRRLGARELPDWEAYRNERLNIETSDIKFTPARSSGLSEKLNVSDLSFSITNKSAYNFWQADAVILLYNRGQLAGVNRYRLERFKSGETRRVEMSMTGGANRADEIRIVPEIDILDKNNYFGFEAAGQ